MPLWVKAWWERRRPAPLDVLTPPMQWGRLRTWLNAVFKRSALRQARARAWDTYQSLFSRFGDASPYPRPSDRIARFAHHIVHSGRPAPIRYLEIGGSEGYSAVYVYVLLDGKVSITVIDPFKDYAESDGRDMDRTFEKFWANIEAAGATNAVQLLKGRSIDHLPKLVDDGAQFDIIYIDGSHAIADVMIDAALGWQLLVRGGLMIFDDYWYRRCDLGREFRPKLAVDAFVGAMAHEISVLDVAGQVFIRKK